MSCVDDKNDSSHDEDSKLFNPPLYIQRYNVVLDILLEKHCKKVVDFGCAECKFIQQMKFRGNFEQIIGVDVQKELLESRKYVCRPIIADYIDVRNHPLQMSLYHGSVTDYDSALKTVDAATLIELIEHLEPDVLEALPECLFGKLKPKTVVITTPNCEYNVLFENFSGMRHWDHKFEWTRNQFEEWCQNVAVSYNYAVEYGGIGAPPDDRKDVGFCSQMAIFTRKNDCVIEENEDVHPYTQIINCYFPHRETNSISIDKKILNEAQYTLTSLSRAPFLEEDTNGHVHIRLEEMLGQSHQLHKLTDNSTHKLREVLEEAGFSISSDGKNVIYPLYPSIESSVEDEIDVVENSNNISRTTEENWA
ncbi:small RNA 2'-O-methyltransferase-like isoform X2 [Tubulanus polymorphus]